MSILQHRRWITWLALAAMVMQITFTLGHVHLHPNHSEGTHAKNSHVGHTHAEKAHINGELVDVVHSVLAQSNAHPCQHDKHLSHINNNTNQHKAKHHKAQHHKASHQDTPQGQNPQDDNEHSCLICWIIGISQALLLPDSTAQTVASPSKVILKITPSTLAPTLYIARPYQVRAPPSILII